MMKIFKYDFPYWFYDTNFVVLLSFLLFLAILWKVDVRGLINKQLDKRSETIRDTIEEARLLRQEAQDVLADYERKLREVEAQSEEIVSNAKAQANQAAKDAKAKLADTVERRIQSGKDQIAAAEAAVERQIKDRAAAIAVEAVRETLQKSLSADNSAQLIDKAIKDVEAKLN